MYDNKNKIIIKKKPLRLQISSHGEGKSLKNSAAK